MAIAFALSYCFILLPLYCIFSYVFCTIEHCSSYVLIHEIEILSSSYILIMTLATETIIWCPSQSQSIHLQHDTIDIMDQGSYIYIVLTKLLHKKHIIVKMKLLLNSYNLMWAEMINCKLICLALATLLRSKGSSMSSYLLNKIVEFNPACFMVLL